MDGVEQRLELLLVLEIGDDLEVVLANGADEREGRVEHQSCLGGAVAVVVGVGDGDGPDVACPATPHACHAERGEGQQREGGGYGVGFPRELAVVECGRAVELPQAEAHGCCQQEEVPVAEGLVGKDAREVGFVLKLVEHGGRGAAQRVLEVDGIAEVDGERQHVDGPVDTSYKLG